MRAYLIRRLWQGAVAVLGALLIVFVAQRLAGDPVALLLPMEATEEDFAAMREALGLDRPLPVQFVVFLRGMRSPVTSASRTSGRRRRCRCCSSACRLPWNWPSRGWCSRSCWPCPWVCCRRSTAAAGWTGLAKVLALLGQAMPGFWVGLLLILFVAVRLQWLPAFGRGGPLHLVLPAIALGWYPVAAMTRTLRSSMLDILDSDYIRAGRVMGLPERTVIWRYALRNAAVPLATMIGVYFANMLGGAFVIEVVFAWPGVGRTVVDAVFARDFPVVQAGVLLSAVIFVVVNLLVDLSYGLIDPRIRHG